MDSRDPAYGSRLRSLSWLWHNCQRKYSKISRKKRSMERSPWEIKDVLPTVPSKGVSWDAPHSPAVSCDNTGKWCLPEELVRDPVPNTPKFRPSARKADVENKPHVCTVWAQATSLTSQGHQNPPEPQVPRRQLKASLASGPLSGLLW